MDFVFKMNVRFFGWELLFNETSTRNLFSNDIEFCKPAVVQGFELNFNLY